LKVIDMCTPGKVVSSAYFMISSKSVSICNRSDARLVHSIRNRAFWCHRMDDSLNLGGRNLHCLKSTFNAENFVRIFSWPIISDFGAFTLKMSVAAWNRKNRWNPLFWGSRSFKVIDVGIAGKLVSSSCYDKQQVVPICNRYHAGRVNSGKITIS